MPEVGSFYTRMDREERLTGVMTLNFPGHIHLAASDLLYDGLPLLSMSITKHPFPSRQWDVERKELGGEYKYPASFIQQVKHMSEVDSDALWKSSVRHFYSTDADCLATMFTRSKTNPMNAFVKFVDVHINDILR